MEWKAIYTDGTFLNQFNTDGSENKYGDIKRDQLSQFQLIKHKTVIAVVHFTEGKQLVYRRRVAVHFAGAKKGLSEAVYLVGWQENRNGVNVQCLCFIFEDGHVEIVDRFYTKHPWLYPINFLPEEMP